MNSLTTTLRSRRRGSVLLLVTVVVFLLSFSAYSFSELMLCEHQAQRAAASRRQLRLHAESGIEAVAAWLDNRAQRELEPAIGNERRFRDVLIGESEFGTAQFSVRCRSGIGFQPVETGLRGNEYDRQDAYPTNVHSHRYGIEDESGRLNLNALPLVDFKRTFARRQLRHLPDITDQLADAILDWMDEDDEPSEFGAESSYYSSLNPPYLPAQKRLTSLEELCQVRGMTPQLLATWREFVTLDSGESNLRRDGSPKINLNSADLVSLFETLEREFNQDVAQFVCAWRLTGSLEGSESLQSEEVEDDFESQRRKLVDTAKRRAREQVADEDADDRRRQDLTRQLFNESSGKREPDVIRAGINLSRKPAHAIRSVVDLIGTNVRIDVDRQDTVLKSPWRDDPARLDAVLRDLSDRMTVTDQPAVVGRININSAPRTVLLSVPGMSMQIADAILAARQRAGGDLGQRGASLGWLVQERICDLRTLRDLAPYVTTRGDVYRGISTGTLMSAGRVQVFSIEFLIDGTSARSRLLSMKEL